MVLNASEYLMCKQFLVNENWDKCVCVCVRVRAHMCVQRGNKDRRREKGGVNRHRCSFKHNSITVGGCCEEEPLAV